MRKTVFAFVLCLLLLCFTACDNSNRRGSVLGNTMEFASSEEMLKHLDGMWVVDADAEGKSYYIFRDGQIYITTDTVYSEQVKQMLDKALQNGGLESFYIQDFANVSNRMYLDDVAITPDSITLFPLNGEIKLYEGQYDEKSIVITEESVLLVTKDTKNGTVMTKLSDTADFSHDNFLSLFNDAKKDYTVPASWLFPSTGRYAEVIKEIHPDIEFFVLTDSSEKTKVYTSDGKTKGSYATFLVSNDTVMYAKGKHAENESAPFLIYYTPNSSNYDLLVQDRNYSDLSQLLQYVEPVLKCFSDKLSISEVVTRFEKEHTVSSGIRSLEITTDGVTCIINQTTDNKTVLIRIEVADRIQIPEEAKENENTESQYAPLQSGTMEQLLDGTKSWVGLWELDGWEYNVHFVFKEDGDCYFALSSETELFGAGVGTYTVKDGKTLSVKMKMNGEKHSVTYAFNPEDFSLTVTSKKGLVAEKGEVVFLQENTDNDAETVEGWAKMLEEGLSEEDEDLLWG